MRDDRHVTTRIIQARPRLKIDPAFTAKVMAEVRTEKLRRFIPWRQLALALAVVAVLVGLGSGTFVLLGKHTPFNVASTNTTGSQSASDADQQQSAKAADYQSLSASAQSDISEMSLQTGSFSDNDYADAQLADSQIY